MTSKPHQLNHINHAYVMSAPPHLYYLRHGHVDDFPRGKDSSMWHGAWGPLRLTFGVSISTMNYRYPGPYCKQNSV